MLEALEKDVSSFAHMLAELHGEGGLSNFGILRPLRRVGNGYRCEPKTKTPTGAGAGWANVPTRPA